MRVCVRACVCVCVCVCVCGRWCSVPCLLDSRLPFKFLVTPPVIPIPRPFTPPTRLQLVVNFDVPSHLEDYIHRCGRTGRAGNNGTAWTLITPEQGKFAGSIIRAIKASGKEIPPDLQALHDSFNEEKKKGKAQAASSGFGGKGYKFDEDEEGVKEEEKLRQGRLATDGATGEAAAAAAANLSEEVREKLSKKAKKKILKKANVRLCVCARARVCVCVFGCDSL